MKKNYLIILLCAISSLAMGQTLEIVEDYYTSTNYPNIHGYNDGNFKGLTPTNLISNSSFIVFSGIEDYYSTSGTATAGDQKEVFTFNGTDINMLGNEYGLFIGSHQSIPTYDFGCAPKNYFLFNDEIYFSAIIGGVRNSGSNTTGSYTLQKVDNTSGEAVTVSDTWAPNFSTIHVANALGGDKIFTARDNGSGYYKLASFTETTVDAPSYHLGSSNDVINYDIKNGHFIVGDFKGYTLGLIACDNIDDADADDTGVELYWLMLSNGAGIWEDLTTTLGESTNPQNFTFAGSKCYFVDDNYELWETTGPGMIGGATNKVAAINDITEGNTAFKILGEFNDQLVIRANDEGVTDGTAQYLFLLSDDGTVEKVTYADATAATLPNEVSIAELGGMLYFTARGENNWTQLAVYDGTNASMISTDLVYRNVGSMSVLDDKLYLATEDTKGAYTDEAFPSTTHIELFVYDPSGTATAIESAFDTNAVTVAPNPSFGYVNIAGIEGNATYDIYSISGGLLESGTVVNGQVDYNVPAGVYLLKVSEGTSSKVVKIMVK